VSTSISDGYFQLNGTSTLTGSGVAFHPVDSGSFQFNGTSHFDLTAPTNGTYADILFFENQHPATTQAQEMPQEVAET
jgi:hypothetical protein